MTQPPELPDVGVRVSLRYLRPPGSEPPMGDVVGQLVQAGPRVRVRSSDGTMHEFRHADVLYVRRLTDRPVKNSAIRSVEHAAALAWPGTEHRWLDGWLLRAAPGAGLAANSAVPLDMFAHANTIPAIIDWYERRELPPYLAVPERLLRLPEDIPTRAETRTLVCELTGEAGTGEVVLAAEPDADWLAVYGRDEPVGVLTAVLDGEVVFAAVPQVAAARAALTEAPDGTRWLGLTALRVAEDRRRRGYGRAIWAALTAWGLDRGATRGYAQVSAGGSASLDAGEAKLGPPHGPGGSASLDAGEAKLGPPHEPGGSASLDAGEAKLGPPFRPADAGAFAFLEAVGFAGQHRTRYLDARLLRSH